MRKYSFKHHFCLSKRQCCSLIWQWATQRCLCRLNAKSVSRWAIIFSRWYFCNMAVYQINDRSRRGTGQNVCRASAMQFHGFYSLTKLYKSKKENSSSDLKDHLSYMYNWPWGCRDELFAFFWLVHWCEGIRNELLCLLHRLYCCTALVSESSKMLHFFTKLSCAFWIYTAQWNVNLSPFIVPLWCEIDRVKVILLSCNTDCAGWSVSRTMRRRH